MRSRRLWPVAGLPSGEEMPAKCPASLQPRTAWRQARLRRRRTRRGAGMTGRSRYGADPADAVVHIGESAWGPLIVPGCGRTPSPPARRGPAGHGTRSPGASGGSTPRPSQPDRRRSSLAPRRGRLMWSGRDRGLCGNGRRKKHENQQCGQPNHREAPSQGEGERAQVRLHAGETPAGPNLFRVWRRFRADFLQARGTVRRARPRGTGAARG